LLLEEIKYPLLLDGGLSNQLESQGCNINHSLWTASIIQHEPEAIVEAHLAYLEAGAQCLITSSYQATIPGFIAMGFRKNEAIDLIRKTVDLAKEAVVRYLKNRPEKEPIFIAASIGPYGAYLSDGSEYRGNYGVTDELLFDFHREKIKILDSTSADILACETIPSLQEAHVLADILHSITKPAWITFSCRDDEYINDGNPLAKAVTLFKDHPAVFGIGINCTHPDYISSLIRITRQHCGKKKIIVYPNSGEEYDAKNKSWIVNKSLHLNDDLVKEWLHLGANIIGGCCRIGPDDIRGLARLLH